MEELAAVVLQVFFELGFQLLGAPGINFSFGSSDQHERSCGWIVLHTFLGGLCGWISTLIFPKLLLAHVGLRIANLIVPRWPPAACPTGPRIGCGRSRTRGPRSGTGSRSPWRSASRGSRSGYGKRNRRRVAPPPVEELRF